MARLALIILSTVTNTTTCECLFSELTQIHTTRHNRFKPYKVKKLSIVRQAVRKKNAIELQSQEASASLLGRIIKAKERKIVGAIDGGDQENAVDIRMEEERIEQRRTIRSRTMRRRKKNLWKSRSTDVLFEWNNILGLGMGEADVNDDEGLEAVEEGQVRPPWPT